MLYSKKRFFHMAHFGRESVGSPPPPLTPSSHLYIYIDLWEVGSRQAVTRK